MGAGDHRVRIEFERDIGTTDTAGQPIPDWQPFDPALKRWGKPLQSKGRAYWAAWSAAQPQTEVTGIIELRYDGAMWGLLAADKSKIRGRIGSRIFYIEAFTDPDERRRTIQLIVKEDL